MVNEGRDLTELSGIGEDLAGKIEEIVRTGDLRQLEEIEQRTPPQLVAMLEVSGLGPKRVQTIYDQLGVTRVEDLRAAAEEGRIRALHGLGEKTEQTILEDVERWSGKEERTRRSWLRSE